MTEIHVRLNQTLWQALVTYLKLCRRVDLSYMLNLDAGKDKAIVLEDAADFVNGLSANNQFVVFPEQQIATFE